MTGQYLPDSDENEIIITHGYSKGHRVQSEKSALSELNVIKEKWKLHKVETVEYEFKTKYAKVE